MCVCLFSLSLALFFLFFSLAHSQRLNLVISFSSRPCCLHSSVFFHAFHPLLLAHLHTMSLNFYSVLVRVSCIFLLLCLLCPPFSLLPINILFTTPFSFPNFLTFDCPIHFLLFISFLNFCFFLFFYFSLAEVAMCKFYGLKKFTIIFGYAAIPPQQAFVSTLHNGSRDRSEFLVLLVITRTRETL